MSNALSQVNICIEKLKMLKSLLGKIRQWYHKRRGIIWEDNRGNVTHQYTFREIDGDERARIMGWKGFSPKKIQYHLTQYGRYDPTPETIYFFLVEDTIHELSHWADEDNEAYNSGVEAHWENWREVIYRELDYTNEKFEIGYE